MLSCRGSAEPGPLPLSGGVTEKRRHPSGAPLHRGTEASPTPVRPEGVAPSTPRGRRSPNAGAPHDSRGAEARFRHRETANLPTVVGNVARGLEGRQAVTGETATKSFV